MVKSSKQYYDLNGKPVLKNEPYKYEADRYDNKLHSIKIYDNNKNIGIIKMSPMKKLSIITIQYYNYFESRYNNNLPHIVSFTNENGDLHGNTIIYDTERNIKHRQIYNNGCDITNDICQYLNITKQQLCYHTFTEEEYFHLSTMYNDLVLNNSYNLEKDFFDKIVYLINKE